LAQPGRSEKKKKALGEIATLGSISRLNTGLLGLTQLNPGRNAGATRQSWAQRPAQQSRAQRGATQRLQAAWFSSSIWRLELPSRVEDELPPPGARNRW